MNRSDGKKCRAIFLLLLIVGQSAIRSTEALRMGSESAAWVEARVAGKAKFGAANSAEAQLRKASAHCWFGHKCRGFGCAHKPLALDASKSAQCRLSDDFMLNDDNINHYMQLNANLLEESSTNYKEECTDLHLWRLVSIRQWRCMRHAGHMLQASRFLARAMGEMEHTNLTAIDRVMPVPLEKAIQNMADASGFDRSLFTALKVKWCTNSSAFLKDPRSHIKFLLGNLVGIATQDKTEMAKVRHNIDAMNVSFKDPPAEQLEEELEDGQEKVEQEERVVNDLTDKSDIDDLLDVVLLRSDASELPPEENGHASSLLTLDNTPHTTDAAPAQKKNIFARGFKYLLHLPLKIHPVAISIILVMLSVAIELYVLHDVWHAIETAAFHHPKGGLAVLVEIFRYVFMVIPIALFELLYHALLHKWKHAAEHDRPHSKNYKVKDPKNFDCDEDIETWQQDWSRKKMVWCCNTESKGCMAPGVPGVPLVISMPTATGAEDKTNAAGNASVVTLPHTGSIRRTGSRRGKKKPARRHRHRRKVKELRNAISDGATYRQTALQRTHAVGEVEKPSTNDIVPVEKPPNFSADHDVLTD